MPWTFLTDFAAVTMTVDATWETIDFSTSCPSARAVILRVKSANSSGRNFGARAVGSAWTGLRCVSLYGVRFVAVALNSSQQAELYRADNNVAFDIVGYHTSDILLVNWANLTITSDGSYYSESLSSIMSIGYQCAFGFIYNGSGSGYYQHNARLDDDTGYNSSAKIAAAGMTMTYMPVSNKATYIGGESANLTYYGVGPIPGGVRCDEPWVDVAPTTKDSWQDIDLSAYVPAGTIGVVLDVYNGDTTTNRYIAIQVPGATEASPPPYIRLYQRVRTTYICGVVDQKVRAYVGTGVVVRVCAYILPDDVQGLDPGWLRYISSGSNFNIEIELQ